MTAKRVNPKSLMAVSAVGIVLYLIMAYGHCGEGARPTEVTLKNGKWWIIDEGNVKIWYEGTTDALSKGSEVENFEIWLGANTEVSCEGQVERLLVVKEEPTRSVCGIRLQLLDMNEEEARFKIFYDP